MITDVQDDSYLDVDRHGVLRIPGLLWLAFAILARHWLLMIAVAASVRRNASSVVLLGDGGVPWHLLLMEAPVILLALAGFYRRPEAGAWARQIWRRGREIIFLTVVLNVGWTALLLYESTYWTPWPELFLGSCALIDLAILAAVYQGPFFRQLFLEFPAKPDPAPSATRRTQP